MEVVQGVDLSSIKIAKGGDRVYKDECIYSFETPESAGGLYVSLHNFSGLGQQWLELHHRKTKDRLFLHITRREIPKTSRPSGIEPPEKKPTRLAIGVEGGFTGGVEKVEYKETHQLVVFPELREIPLPCADLPLKILESLKSILSAESASKKDSVLAWEGDVRKSSRHADTLVQLDNGVKIPPSGWQCEKCDLTNNLWLNLTDGKIHCGRRYFDGSGGNNHAVDHYDTTKYPLAVKLGTITPGGADVYSYDEDDMVLDPKLPEHLSHFGINMMIMNKTDKTMTELEIDMNIRIGEWSIIQESGRELKLLYGSGYTGLQNLGNSCYINSVMQVLFALPELKARYYEKAVDTFIKHVPDPTKDFNVQMCKLSLGLLSGEYSQKPLTEEQPSSNDSKDEKPKQKEQPGIAPLMFKTLVGAGHREFSSNRQQDAQEFFLHLMTLIDRAQHANPGSENIVDLFRYQVEEKIKCIVSNKVRYSEKPELLVTLPVPLEEATNQAEVRAWEEKKAVLEAQKMKINYDEVVRAKVPFSACLSKYSTPCDIPDFYSSALQAKSKATRTYRFSSFPEYLMVQLARFTFNESWEPIKYDVEIDVPESLDLSLLRAQGIQPGEEELLPTEGIKEKAEQIIIDETIVMQLVSMGFDMEGCKRAVYHTKNQGVEPAMNWVLEHMGNPDFGTPFDPSPSKQQGSGNDDISEDGIAIVMSLGFTRDQAIKALVATDNNIERAADWVFSHMDELQQSDDSSTAKTSEKEKNNYQDGCGKYQLLAFISHMGTSTMAGHYVCHIKKDGRWVIFNDNKVAESVAPPKQHGYLYVFKRQSS